MRYLPGLRSISSAKLLALALALTAAVVIACGSEDESTATATTQPPTSTSTTGASSPTSEPSATTSPASPTAEPSATTGPASPTAQPSSTPMSGDGPGVASVEARSDSVRGDILVDGEGMTLYIFDNDTEGVSNCTGGCLSAWPPLLTEGEPEVGSGVTAEIGAIEREDGSMQVTVNGFPAYYWQGDSAPGDTAGHGVNNVWWVFNPDGTPQRPAKIGVSDEEQYGNILTDGEGVTLYIFDRDTEGVSNCSGNCLNNWPPLLTEDEPVALEGVSAEIGTITRDDDSMQVTINGFPAYYWQGDAAPGDTAGHGVGGNWWVFNADGSPQRPAKVGLAEHDTLGNILVDGAGMTLYLFDNDEVGVSNCSGGCLNNWPPLLTDYPPVALSDVTAEIGTITRDDSTMQVTVNGLPVYFWQGDSEPGDATGQAVGGVWWVMGADGSAIH